MTADPFLLVGVILAHLRRATLLGKVPTDRLWPVVEHVDGMLRQLGLTPHPERGSDLLLACIGASANALPRPDRRRTRVTTVRCDTRRPAGRTR